MDNIILDPQVRACVGLAGMRLMIRGNVAEEGAKVLGLCCEDKLDLPAVALADTAEETLERFVGMRYLLCSESIKYSTDYASAQNTKYLYHCLDCVQFQHNYGKGFWTLKPKIDWVALGIYPSPCQAYCIYCGARRDGLLDWSDSPRIKEGYEKVFRLISLADELGMVELDAVYDICTGEIAINPFQERLFETIKGKRAQIYTNCMVYSEHVANHLRTTNGSWINFSLDAGTAQSWKRVKGIDNFYRTVENYKRYCMDSHDLGAFQLKYIILPGINDSKEDFLFVANYMKECGLDRIAISRDFAHRYLYEKEYHDKLINSAISFASVLLENQIQPHFSIQHYSAEEKAQIEQAVGMTK